MEKPLDFPKGFLWGSATASYQVEGGILNCDWAVAALDGKVPPAGIACGHYDRYEKDYDTARLLGQNAHRFSIEWARVEPQEGIFDKREIEHYRAVLKALRSRSLEPFVTLWHFTLPQWFAASGGWRRPDAAKIFARYCRFVIEQLGGEAHFWMTMNEPMIWSSSGYFAGQWPPFEKNIFAYLGVIRALIRGHILAYREMKAVAPDISIGFAKNNISFESDGKIWNRFAASFMRWFWNRRFLNRTSSYFDFIGLNHYIHRRFGRGPFYRKTEMNWDIFPEAFYQVLMELGRYNKTVYVTENGIADKNDEERAEYIRSYLKALHRTIENGIDVRGYFYWSLLDNFEWAYGFEKCFGLIEVNSKTLERKIRPSAFVYKAICEKNVL